MLLSVDEFADALEIPARLRLSRFKERGVEEPSKVNSLILPRDHRKRFSERLRRHKRRKLGRAARRRPPRRWTGSRSWQLSAFASQAGGGSPISERSKSAGLD